MNIIRCMSLMLFDAKPIRKSLVFRQFMFELPLVSSWSVLVHKNLTEIVEFSAGEMH